MAECKRMQEDLDESSVATAVKENRNITYRNEAKEYVAKFTFQPTNQATTLKLQKPITRSCKRSKTFTPK
jgi:hypothetical protein